MHKIQLNSEFYEYLHRFEQIVITELPLWTIRDVSKRECKLSKQKFGQILGTSFVAEMNCVIDYFGLLKKSTGFLEFAESHKTNSVPTNLLHFQSIKIETIFALDPAMVTYFPIFKGTLLAIRGFKSS